MLKQARSLRQSTDLKGPGRGRGARAFLRIECTEVCGKPIGLRLGGRRRPELTQPYPVDLGGATTSNVSKIGGAEFEHILSKARAAQAGGRGALSTGEAIVAALVLNRPGWLLEMNYTIAEAIERIGPEWARLVPPRRNNSAARGKRPHTRRQRRRGKLNWRSLRRGSELRTR
jgi:hypothetical protein